MTTVLTQDSPVRFKYDELLVQFFNYENEDYRIEGKHFRFNYEQNIFTLPVLAIKPDLNLKKVFIPIDTAKKTFTYQADDGTTYETHQLVNGKPYRYILDKDYEETGKYYLIPSDVFHNKGYDKIRKQSYLDTLQSRYAMPEYERIQDITYVQGESFNTFDFEMYIVNIYVNRHWVKALTLDDTFINDYVDRKLDVQFLLDINGQLCWLNAKHLKLS